MKIFLKEKNDELSATYSMCYETYETPEMEEPDNDYCDDDF